MRVVVKIKEVKCWRGYHRGPGRLVRLSQWFEKGSGTVVSVLKGCPVVIIVPFRAIPKVPPYRIARESVTLPEVLSLLGIVSVAC